MVVPEYSRRTAYPMSTAQRHDLRLFCLSAAASAVGLAIVLSIVTLGFESNDDVGMARSSRA